MYPHAKDALRNGIEYIYGSGVHGDVAEFGTYQGRTAAVLAEAMIDCDHQYGSSDKLHGISQRKLWLFDSFKGLPAVTHPADAASPHLTSGVWREGAISDTSPSRVQGFVEQFIPKNRINVIPGFFKESLEQLPTTTRFAFVHLDCDYYESTLQVLTFLKNFGMFSDGCALYFDDWYCNRGSPRYGQQAAWRNFCSSCGFSTYTDWGAYGIVGRRFIVHNPGVEP